jgi:RNA:NAD 2''-phosphotransferase
METATLYHGTTAENAELLLEHGWEPNKVSGGGNCGQSRYLYLSTGYEDALWFAEQKGSDIVLEVSDIPLDHLRVDPEDGVYDTVEEEMSSPGGFPGKLVLTRPLEASRFRRVTLTEVATI